MLRGAKEITDPLDQQMEIEEDEDRYYAECTSITVEPRCWVAYSGKTRLLGLELLAYLGMPPQPIDASPTFQTRARGNISTPLNSAHLCQSDPPSCVLMIPSVGSCTRR